MTPVGMFVKLDRSRVVARQTCAKRRYLEYDYKGTGVSPLQTGDALSFGIALHNIMQRVLTYAKDGTPIDWDAINAEVTVPYAQQVLVKCNADANYKGDPMHKANEQGYLLEMLAYGWAQQRLPKLMEEYDIVSIEQEFEVGLVADVKLMLRIDAVLRHKATGLLYILDFKSLSNLTDDWMVKQEHSAQSSLYIFALEQASGEYVAGIMYEGLAKGISRTEKSEFSPWQGMKLQVTPLCYVYTDGTNVKHEYTKAKGWKKVQAWHMHSVKEHYEVLRALYEGDLPQFCVVPPVRPAQHALDRTVKQTIVAEREYYAKVTQVNAAFAQGQDIRAQELEDALFELSYGSCYKYGASHACPFTGVCHGGASPDDETLFVPRTPHHDGEFEDGE
jgi:hypothetical protein